jgi:hypothetical protein
VTLGASIYLSMQFTVYHFLSAKHININTKLYIYSILLGFCFTVRIVKKQLEENSETVLLLQFKKNGFCCCPSVSKLMAAKVQVHN